MKFINYLTSIAGVEIFPMVSLFIFFLFFVGLIIYVFKSDKEEMLRMKSLPIEQDKKAITYE
jgi:cytochrome c oxidase cbb3-type subunit III